MNIIYINGRFSTSTTKVDYLKEFFPNDNVEQMVLDIENPEKVLDYLHYRTFDDTIFVGTSMGAFWAALLGSNYGCQVVLMNPCFDPVRMINGISESYPTTKSPVDQYYDQLKFRIPKVGGYSLLSKNDPLLGKYWTEYNQRFGESHWIQYTDDDQHQFVDLNLMVRAVDNLKKHGVLYAD